MDPSDVSSASREYNRVSPQEVVWIDFCLYRLKLTQAAIARKIQNKRQKECVKCKDGRCKMQHTCAQSTISLHINRPFSPEVMVVKKEFLVIASRYVWPVHELEQRDPFVITQYPKFGIFLDNQLICYAAEQQDAFLPLPYQRLEHYGMIASCVEVLLFGKQCDFLMNRFIYSKGLQDLLRVLGLDFENNDALFQLQKMMLEVLVYRNNAGCFDSNQNLIRCLSGDIRPSVDIMGTNDSHLLDKLKSWSKHCKKQENREPPTDLLHNIVSKNDPDIFCQHFLETYGKSINLQQWREWNPKSNGHGFLGFLLSCFNSRSISETRLKKKTE